VKLTRFFILFLFYSCQSFIPIKEVAKDYYNIANAYFKLKDYKIAAEFYKKAQEFNPNILKSNYNLARTYIELGYLDKSKEIIENLLKEDENHPSLLEALAYIYFLKKDLDNALKYYLEALNYSSPYNIDVKINIALIYKEKEDIKIFKDTLEDIIKYDPENRKALSELSELAFRAEDKNTAAFYLSRIKQKEIEDIEKLADLYIELKDYNNALITLDQIIYKEEEDKKNQALFKKAKILLKELNDPSGIDLLKEAIENNFRSKDQIQELLDDKDLIEKEKIKEILNDLDLLIKEEKISKKQEDEKEKIENNENIYEYLSL